MVFIYDNLFYIMGRKANLDTTDGLLYRKEIETGISGKARKMDYQKLMMDKDYIWKLDIILEEAVQDFEMSYKIGFVFDPSTYNEKLDQLVKESRSQQMRLGDVTEKLNEEMLGVHNSYDENLTFSPFEFEATLTKFEKKSLGKQALQFCVDMDAAIAISKLGGFLDKTAIVLRAYTAVKEEE